MEVRLTRRSRIDNHAAITLACHHDQRQNTKHIDVRYHLFRNLQETYQIGVEYVNTGEQFTDILTKPLQGPRFKIIREALGIVVAPASSE